MKISSLLQSGAWRALAISLGGCLAIPYALAQTGPVTITHALDPQRTDVYFAYEDARGCLERVREPVIEWNARVPTIAWSGGCVGGLRDGVGMFKLYDGKRLLVASTGRYADGFRIGPWRWEFPDGRRLEARFIGDAREPIERIVESVHGERQVQRLSAGTYRDEPGIAPAPELSGAQAAARADPVKPVPGRGEAASYAAAHFPVASCAGRAGIDRREDLLATRRDVDRFVRDGEGAVRQEVADDIAVWSRALVVSMIHALAHAPTPSGPTADQRVRMQSVQDRLLWLQCHQKNGLPYLARIAQAVAGCERASLFRLERVRASGNSRLQAEFADCLHADIHSARWVR